MSGSRNYVKSTFEFSDEWNGLTKTAIFKASNGTVYNVLLENNACIVPWEVLATSGAFEVSVFGGDLITVNSAKIIVEASAYATGGAPTEPTQTVYQQILNSLDSKVATSDLDGTSIYKGTDNKIHANTGANIIDDTTSSTAKTYSSNKIDSLNASNIKTNDLDGTTVYKGTDNKIHAQGGATIDDEETSNTKTWSSGKIYNEISSLESEFVALTDLDGTSIYKGADNKIHAQGGSGGNVIDDTTTSTSKTYSSSKIESVITSKGYKTETEINSLIDAKIQALGNAESESY